MPVPPLPFVWLATQAANFKLARLKRNLKRNAFGLALMGLFALITLVFTLVALFAALAEEFGPIWAALAIAAFFGLLTAITWWGLKIAAARDRRRTAAEAEARRVLVTDTALALLPILPTLLRSRAGLAIIVPVAVVGYLLLSRRGTNGKDPPKTVD